MGRTKCGEFRKCPKCQTTMPRVDFGSAGYCKPCWRAYNRERARLHYEPRPPRVSTFASAADALHKRIAYLDSLKANLLQQLAKLEQRYAETLPENPNDNA